MTGGSVEVVSSKGCSRLFVGSSTFLPSANSLRFMTMMSPASSSLSEPTVPLVIGPFAGLVICVTGLSKEARKEVMAATERLGGQYSASLHPQCTHLVVQSCTGRKFEHAMQYGSRNGLFIVTLGWFVDSVKRNVRLSESLYSVKTIGGNGLPLGELNRLVAIPGSAKSCLPSPALGDEKSSGKAWQPPVQPPKKEDTNGGSVFSNNFIFVDPEISDELKKKVIEAGRKEGATFLNDWFIGCRASHIVCEGPSIQRYMGHANNLVTPLWVLKTAKEKCMQRLVHLSSDLAKQVSVMLENAQTVGEVGYGGSVHPVSKNSRRSLAEGRVNESLEERQKAVELAKLGVRSRRGRRIQSCQVPIHPITPGNLLESISWTVSEPTSSARVYVESSSTEDTGEQHSFGYFNARGDGKDSEALLENFSRPLRESERMEVILKSHFLTILFPVDRFGELGPSSRTFYGDGGFTSGQILDHIYNFYQENMSADEINLAMHTDSRHADRLRSLYTSKESVEQGALTFKRIDFLGSRRSFETLKRVGGENNGNVYEVLVRA
ncbi:BRCA1 C Terminus (BRCT) domain [Musa troglodytarum]|uniref:BRCA1 C Terminus (BRCT) domain n=1 Tax=Musa troglodytarum TaxID=320322 RepID=A0A9E7KNS6_9LILI|nr:BRCA1 C Terminus (BRCT) domain [Musa troglodytarum]URE24036.1 BRCA1 C Terminus (BRCT) domain [Musa troglodytarum]